MSTVLEEPRTIANLLEGLGDIPPERVRLSPFPASADDVARIWDRERRLFELVDGVLVEKPMGFWESRVAIILGYFFEKFLENANLGIVAGEAGMVQLQFGLVRIPDLSFVSWKRLPGRRIPRKPVPALVPDLAVEVLSASNTEAEIRRKLREYFAAGVRLVWVIDPETRTACAYTSLKRVRNIPADGVLEGGKVLPGFSLALQELFDRAERGPNGKNHTK